MEGMSGRAMTVSELNEYARKLLAGDPLLRNLEVTGEISGYKHHYSGHRYFFIKDADARVQCVMFRQNAMGLDFTPADGMRVTLRGSASLFVRDGSYQIYVTSMHRSGVGDLYVRFEQLKARLMAEGLFDPARKREIPMFPKKIGIATSETGAAIRDMIRVARRRNPNVGILVAPCAVQGASAAPEIVRAIKRLNDNGECDVLLVGRGGGSIEDLWAFNEESVARAIAGSRIPVISCVGHEVDFTIADFVADLRAATPSVAAELAVPVLDELQQSLTGLGDRLVHSLNRGQQVRRTELNRLGTSSALSMPRRTLLEASESRLKMASKELDVAMSRRMEQVHKRLALAGGMLRAMDPARVVDRGYAIVSIDGHLAARADSVSVNDRLQLKMAGGEVCALATDVKVRMENGEKEDNL